MKFSDRRFFAPNLSSINISLIQERRSKPQKRGAYRFEVVVFEYFNGGIVLNKFKVNFSPNHPSYFKPNQILDEEGFFSELKPDLLAKIQFEIQFRIFQNNRHIRHQEGDKAAYHTPTHMGTFSIYDMGVRHESEYKEYGVELTNLQKQAILSYFKTKPKTKKMEMAA